MPHKAISSRHVPSAALLLILATMLLSACGSSSTSTSSARSGTTAATAAQPGQHAVAFRECLRKSGIAIPGTGGAPTLPAGVNPAQYQAAVKKCGGLPGVPRPGPANLASSQLTGALAKFAACMRANGVNVPAPNTSGKGPVFDTKGLDPTSAKFVAARKKCAPLLLKSLRAHPGASGAPVTPGG